MAAIIGIDSRIFVRDTIRKDRTPGHFESVLGVAVKVNNYDSFVNDYKTAITSALSDNGIEPNYLYYCTHDLRHYKEYYDIVSSFSKTIRDSIDKLHVFYTLFSPKRIEKVNVYGRYSRRTKLHLSHSTRTYSQLIKEHLVNCFPAICAWRLMEHFAPNPSSIIFHLDSYSGRISEAYEELEESTFHRRVYPSGDCTNPVISTADLFLGLLDKRLEKQKRPLIFENIRPALSEFGENVLAYPIMNKHLPKITPIDNIPIDVSPHIPHPVFWVMKTDPLLNAGVLKGSKAYRSLLDYAANQGGVVKLFEKAKDIRLFQNGDTGVYFDSKGKETIDSYKKMGKKLIPLSLDTLVPDE